MIDYVKGSLVDLAPGKAIIDINGVGICLEMPFTDDDFNKLIGREVTLYTRLLIKDEAIIIYGFRAVEERKLFNLIISVSGFGPRLALSLLGVLTVSQLYLAVLEENIALLTRAHGVGRKAAQRLVLELKEKLPKVISGEDLLAGPVLGSGNSVTADITEALCALGYSPVETNAAVVKALENNDHASPEELLKLVLKDMATRQ
jgi:holliday junction DNA helicase RuvA